MDIKGVFGKDLFNYKREPEQMYDFAQHGVLDSQTYGLDYAYIDSGLLTSSTTAASSLNPSLLMYVNKKKEEPEPEDKDKPKKTPKELFEAKALNNNEFKFNIEVGYIQEQIDLINDKLDMMGRGKKSSGGTLYGKKELESMLTRLKNRRKILKFKDIIDEYPHTTSEQIALLLKEQKNLKCEKAAEFIPDFPKDAIKAMKRYEKMCLDLCNQKPNFYVIADKKDFDVKTKRRDPILLAQSPFGFFWQILGAWDKEMMYLGDL